MSKPESTKESQLWKAIRHNDIPSAQKLLTSNLADFDRAMIDGRYFDNHCIIKALTSSHVEMARLLIDKGFRICRNPADNEATVLEYAVRCNDIDLIKLLLEKGAAHDILTTNNRDKTALHVAIHNNYLSIIDLFLPDIDLELFESMNFLDYIVRTHKTEVIKYLIDKGFSMIKRNSENQTAFCIAMRSNALKSLDCLVSNYPVKNINPDNYDDVAPIYIAIMRDNLEVIKKYADSNLPINNVLKPSEEPWYSIGNLSGSTLLHVAVQYNNLQIFKFLLTRGADLFIKNADGSSPLHLAFQKKERGCWTTWEQFENNNFMIAAMLKTNLKFNFNPENKNGLTHLHIACSRDEPAIIEHFLKIGTPNIDQSVKPDHPCFGGFTPLHFSAKFRCTKTLEYLLKHGADVKIMDAKNMTALHIAAKEECVESVRLLLQYGADISLIDFEGNSPLHNAFKNKNYEVIDLFLSIQHIDTLNKINNEGLSSFHILCTRDRIDIVEKLIKKGVALNVCALPKKSDGNEDLPAYYWSGYTPLHFAVAHNRAEIVELLLNSGADVNLKDLKGLTPLHTACKYTLALFEEFIKNTLEDLSKKGKIKSQPKPVTDVNSVDEEYFGGFSSFEEKIDYKVLNISWSKNRTDQLKIINLLLNSKSDINSIDSEGNSPVYYAYSSVDELPQIIKNNMNCAKPLWNKIVKGLFDELYDRRKLIISIFLKLNINLDECYKNGSILYYICSIKHDKDAERMMEDFLKKGAKVNVTNGCLTPLHQAIAHDNKNCLKILLKYGANVNSINLEFKSTPLLTATFKPMRYKYCIEMIKMLIDKGAFINARTSNGKTVLHNLALEDRSSEFIDPLVSMLITSGADVNSQDSEGLTPLHLSILKNRSELTKELLKYAPDLSIEDNKGRSVICCLNEKQLTYLITNFQVYILKMYEIGLSLSQKALNSYNDFIRLVRSQHLTLLFSDEQKKEFSTACHLERETLCAKKIRENCSLYNVIFKKETDLTNIARNLDFKAIVESDLFNKTYPHYGFLIRLKYQAGLDRSNLLKTVNSLFDILAGKHVIDVCCEYICEYFSNVELRECIYVLSSVLLDANAKSAGNNDNNKQPTRIRQTNKRKKVC